MPQTFWNSNKLFYGANLYQKPFPCITDSWHSQHISSQGVIYLMKLTLCDYLKQSTWKKIIQSQCFLETKDSQVFFMPTKKIQVSTKNRWKLKNNLNLPDLSGNSPSLRISLARLQKFLFSKTLWLDNLLPRPSSIACTLFCRMHDEVTCKRRTRLRLLWHLQKQKAAKQAVVRHSYNTEASTKFKRFFCQ